MGKKRNKEHDEAVELTPGDNVTEDLSHDDFIEREEELKRDEVDDTPTPDITEYSDSSSTRPFGVVEHFEEEEPEAFDAPPQFPPDMFPRFFAVLKEMCDEQSAIARRNGYRQIEHDWNSFKNMAVRLEKTTQTDYWSKKLHEQG